jgi:hypothetical protein
MQIGGPVPNFAIREGSLSLKAIKDAVPRLEVKCAVEFSGMRRGDWFAISGWKADASVCGIPVPVGNLGLPNPMLFDTEGPIQGLADFSVDLFFYPEVLRLIEKVRTGDVSGSISIGINYVVPRARTEPGKAPMLGFGSEANSRAIPLKYSRDEWSKLLGELGYSGSWVVELPRPSAAAWPEVETRLQQAEQELRSLQVQAAASKCREAWEIAKPLISDRWQNTREIIQRGSKDPGSYSTKADRVITTYNDVDLLLNDARYLADMAAHGAVHALDENDSLLIYRLSHSILAYLSRQMQVAQGPSVKAS